VKAPPWSKRSHKLETMASLAAFTPPPATCPSGSPLPFFEGTEKRIEVDFAGEGDLRKVPNADWEEVIRLSQTLALHRKETEQFTSYLLSESSLIIYPTKLVLKTCGRTVPISGVKKMFSCASSVGLEPEWLCYSRKNFLAPGEQPTVHASSEVEIATCKSACNNVGDSYILGPLTGEHWLVYDAQFKVTDCSQRGDFHVDIMMYNLDPTCCRHFFSTAPEGCPTAAKAMTKESGLGDCADLINGEVDDYCFAPCGYSCNIHAKDGAYAMVHVTPQEDCSYASFETNFGSQMDSVSHQQVGASLSGLVRRVLQVFRPGKFTMTLFMDQGAEKAIGSAPFDAPDGSYQRKTCTSTQFEQDYICTVANYTILESARGVKRPGASEEALGAVKSPPPRLPRTSSGD